MKKELKDEINQWDNNPLVKKEAIKSFSHFEKRIAPFKFHLYGFVAFFFIFASLNYSLYVFLGRKIDVGLIYLLFMLIFSLYLGNKYYFKYKDSNKNIDMNKIEKIRKESSSYIKGVIIGVIVTTLPIIFITL